MAPFDAPSDRAAGWYADPVTVGAARYWDGEGWTDSVSWGGRVGQDPTSIREVERQERLARTSIVSEYLVDATRRDVISPMVADLLRRDLQGGRSSGARPSTLPTPPTPLPTPAEPVRPQNEPRPASSDTVDHVATPPRAEPVLPPTTTPVPAAARVLPRPTFDRPTVVEHEPPVDVPVVLPKRPGRAAQWWADTREALLGDLALHGLAYLGVLLLFAGVTGLITFSFGDVDPWVRSLAEFLVPGALLLSSWYLGRRGATFVAAALSLLGGAILPIIVAASLTDGAPVPPDVHGTALPLSQGAAVALVAVAMALTVRRSPTSPLRYVAGPALWMAAGLASGVARDPAPSGYDTARPDSIQLAVVLAAIAATLLICSWRRVPAALAEATRLVALPAAVVVFVLELVLAADEGWPIAGTVIVGIGTVVLLEFSVGRLGPSVTSISQFLVVTYTAVRLSGKTTPEWVAVVAAMVLLLLVEDTGRRRPANLVVLVGLTLSGTGFVLGLGDAGTRAVGAGTLVVWGLWRHRSPPDWLSTPDRFGVVPAIAAVVAATAWWEWTGPGTALVGFGVAVMLCAITGRLWSVVADDPLWKWFVPVAAGAIWATSVNAPFGDLSVEVAVASAACAVAIALSVLTPAARVWGAAAPVVWSLVNVAEALGIDRDVGAVLLAIATLAVLLGALVRNRAIDAHVATIAQIVAVGSIGIPTWPGWAATVVVGAATTGWWSVTVADQAGRAVHLDALRSVLAVDTDPNQIDMSPVVGYVPPIVSFLGSWTTVILATDATGWVAYDDPWASAVACGVAVLAGLAVRVTPWRSTRRAVLAWVTLVGALVATFIAIDAVGTDRAQWAPIVCLGSILVVIGVAAAPRPRGFDWVGWASGAAFIVYLVDRLGVGRSWADLVVAGWGGAALLGALALNRVRLGPLPVGSFVQDPKLHPPIVLGSVAFVVGGAMGLGDGTNTAIGWTATGMSAVVLVTAILVPLGVLVAPAELLATAAYALLAPWGPIDRPWTFAPWAVLLLGAAAATRRDGGWSPARWDLPSFVVAHLVAGLALVAAADIGVLAPTSAAFGAVSIAIAVVLRRPEWAMGGAALMLVAGVDAGPGWLALVLVVEGVAATVVGLQRTGLARSIPIGIGTFAIVGAWFSFADWQAWSASTVFFATVPSTAVVTVVAVTGLRSVRVPDALGAAWALVAPLVLLGTAAGTLDAVSRRPGGLVLAGALLTSTAAAALATPVAGSVMRWIAVAPAAAAWWSMMWAFDLSAATIAEISTAVALASSVATFLLHGRRPDTAWSLPALAFALATQVGAGVASLADFPNRVPLIVVMLALAAESAILGMLTERVEPLALSPAAAAAAWSVGAQGALVDEVDAWAFFSTMPVGATVAVLAAVTLRFSDVRRGLVATWAGVGSFVVVGTAIIGLVDVGRVPGGLILAGSLLVLAAAAATTAPDVGPIARWATAALVAAAWLAATWAVEPSASVATMVTTAAALAVLSLSLTVGGQRPGSPWLHPVVFLTCILQGGAMVPAIDSLPDRDLVIVTLLAVSAESIGIGTLLHRPAWYVVTPVPACVAWLLYAGEALSGEAIWFTVPVGLTLLVMVGQVRWIRRSAGGDPAAPEIVALEIAGMSFLVASSLARTLGGHLWQGVMAIGIGAVLAGWGAVTRVRWRAEFGALSVLLATVLVLGVPLSRSITWRGPTLWLTLSVLGISAIVIASVLEQNRRRIGDAVERLDQLTTDWEHLTLHRGGRDESKRSTQATTGDGSNRSASAPG